VARKVQLIVCCEAKKLSETQR